MRIRYQMDFPCANVHFESKPSKMVGEYSDTFCDVGPGFKEKWVVIYINNAEYMKESEKCEDAGFVAH